MSVVGFEGSDVCIMLLSGRITYWRCRVEGRCSACQVVAEREPTKRSHLHHDEVL